MTMIPNREYKVAISTTSNPYTDWCGIFEGVISGVVDVLVRPLISARHKPIIMGEASGSYSSGLWQVVANYCKCLQSLAYWYVNA